MTNDRLDLSGFVVLLGRHPEPDIVTASLVTGPLAEFGALSALITVARDGSLVIVGTHGFTADEIDAYRVMPLDSDTPPVRAFHHNDPLVIGAADVATEFDGSPSDYDTWDRIQDRQPVGSVVAAPIALQGVAIGAFVVTCAEARDWTPDDIAILNALSAALSLWLSHPVTRAGLGAEPDAHPVHLRTPRQQEICRAIASGRSNAAIARQLGVSESTVKQEIGRIKRLLGADGREALAGFAIDAGLL